jgi:hypothetical protein
MSFVEKAKSAVIGCAELLESEAHSIGILRSMEATEASNWLKDIAAQLRGACVDGDDPVEDAPAPLPYSPWKDMASWMTLARFKQAGLDNAMAVQAQNVALDIIEELQEFRVKKGLPT